MNNQMQQFHNKEFGSLEIMIADGKTYFPATECAEILGYSNPRKAIIDHCRWVTKRDVPHPQSIGKTIARNFIPEGDLYRLIIRSKLPAAERFERWVFDAVLPAIRKHGAYVTSDTLEEMLRSPKFTEALIRKLAEERQKNVRLEKLAEDLDEFNDELVELTEELAPKALYCDIILQTQNAVPVSLIAKDYGMSATAFNRLLHSFSIQYPIAGTWLLYQGYADMGYTHTRTYMVNKWTSAMHTCWTQKGRLFLYETLKRWGILPLIEKYAYAN